MAAAGTVAQREIAAQALGYAFAQPALVPRSTLVAFMRIASRESGFDPGAHNGNASTGDNSYGLWQINTLSTGQWNEVRNYFDPPLTDRAQLFAPRVNAIAAVAMYRRYGWKPWRLAGAGELAGTLTETQVLDGIDLDGAVKAGAVARSAGEPASNDVAGTGGTGNVGGPLGTAVDVVTDANSAAGTVLDAATAIPTLIAKLMSAGFWKRLGLGAAGVALVVLAVVAWKAGAAKRLLSPSNVRAAVSPAPGVAGA